MDFFGDFCLACDKQTNGTAYCSQACRLAELDLYTLSSPSSPTQSDAKPSSRKSSDAGSSGLYLPPAIDFSMYRVSSTTSITTAKSTASNSARISEKARHDLNDYVTSFDQTRTLRRRVSMQSNEEKETTSKHRWDNAYLVTKDDTLIQFGLKKFCFHIWSTIIFWNCIKLRVIEMDYLAF